MLTTTVVAKRTKLTLLNRIINKFRTPIGLVSSKLTAEQKATYYVREEDEDNLLTDKPTDLSHTPACHICGTVRTLPDKVYLFSEGPHATYFFCSPVCYNEFTSLPHAYVNVKGVSDYIYSINQGKLYKMKILLIFSIIIIVGFIAYDMFNV